MYDVLCHATLRHARRCYAVLCCAMPCQAVLCCAVLCCVCLSTSDVQTGAARQAVQAFLSPGLVTIYTAFAVQQLTAQVSQCDAAQVILEYCTACFCLVAALPSDQAPADMRVQRSPMWPCSQATLLPSGTDIVTPPTQDATAVHATPPAAAAALGDKRAGQADLSTQALPAPQLASHEAPMTLLTRAQAVQLMDFLVRPPDGLIWGVLNNSSKPARERQAALGLLTAIYQCNSSSVTEDADHAAFCSKVHFTGYTRAYAEDDIGLCCQHLKALQALAKHKVGLPLYHMLLLHCQSISLTLAPQQIWKVPGHDCDWLSNEQLCVQIPAVRQQLLELNAMSFLIQQLSLESKLQMNVSVPVSSTPTTAPTNASGFHDAAAQPSSCPARPSGLLQPDAPAGIHKVPASSLEPESHRTSFRSLSSRLRLPALPPGSARSPRISARYPGLQAGSGAAKAVEPSGSAPSPIISARSPGLQLPAGFVSTGDLEEDTQQLLDMGSEVRVSLHCCFACPWLHHKVLYSLCCSYLFLCS